MKALLEPRLRSLRPNLTKERDRARKIRFHSLLSPTSREFEIGEYCTWA